MSVIVGRALRARYPAAGWEMFLQCEAIIAAPNLGPFVTYDSKKTKNIILKNINTNKQYPK